MNEVPSATSTIKTLKQAGAFGLIDYSCDVCPEVGYDCGGSKWFVLGRDTVAVSGHITVLVLR